MKGEAEGMLSKDKYASWSAGHGDAHPTAVLPAARKKGMHCGFPVESSCKSWSARCARSKRSYDRLCCDWLALRRRRELDGAMAAAAEKQRR